MRHLLIFWGILSPVLVFGQVVKVPPRKPVPPQVLKAAQAATQKLADRVVRGDLAAPIEKMFPAWKKREARKAGGVARFEQRLMKKLKELRAQGVVVNVMQAAQPFSAFEVNFGLEEQIIGGKKTKVGVYRNWLVFVPTVSIVRAVNEATNPPEIVNMKMESFQVAICKKGTNDWTFMDGNQVKAFQLRQLFPYLPAEDAQLGLPKVNGKIVQRRGGNAQDQAGRKVRR